MELYNLNLCTALRYRAAGTDLAGLLAAAAKGGDGAEYLARWDYGAAVADGDEGPRAVRPLPAPRFAGSLAPSGEDGDETLAAGAWLFCQAKAEASPATADGIADLIEWFARESWWTGDRGSGDLYLRLVLEDGGMAVQALRRPSGS